MDIKLKTVLGKGIIKQEKKGAWCKQIYLLDSGKYMIDVFWSGIEYRPHYYKICDSEEEAREIFELIKNAKKVPLYLKREVI